MADALAAGVWIRNGELAGLEVNLFQQELLGTVKPPKELAEGLRELHGGRHS